MRIRPGRFVRKFRCGLDVLAYRGLLPRPLAQRRISRFWENYARPIHEAWGNDDDDFGVLDSIIRRHGICSVLDLGCGSGRLFDVYRRAGVTRILGVDIATEALALAEKYHPEVPTHQCRVEALPAGVGQWDLVVSNRVLQHVPATDIAGVVRRLAGIARLLYINELSESDTVAPEFFMQRYDYPALFGGAGFVEIERGRIGQQTWRLFGTLEGSGHPS